MEQPASTAGPLGAPTPARLTKARLRNLRALSQPTPCWSPHGRLERALQPWERTPRSLTSRQPIVLLWCGVCIDPERLSSAVQALLVDPHQPDPWKSAALCLGTEPSSNTAGKLPRTGRLHRCTCSLRRPRLSGPSDHKTAPRAEGRGLPPALTGIPPLHRVLARPRQTGCWCLLSADPHSPTFSLSTPGDVACSKITGPLE